MSCFSVSSQALRLSPKVNLWVKSVPKNGVSTLTDGKTKLLFHRSNVEVCGQLYQQFKERGWKRYKDVPKEGIKAQVEYYDNKYIVGDKSPSNVLLLSGVPSTFAILKPVIDYYNDNGIRVIYPKFPDFSLTRSCKYFRHSAEERAELVKAVLQETGVDDFDVVVSHSSGNYTGVQLWKDPEGPVIRSFAWLNPCPPEAIIPMKPYWLIRQCTKMYQTAAGRYLVEKLFVKALKAMGNPFVENSMDTIMLGAFVLHYSHVHQLVEDLKLIQMKKFPLLVTVTDNDKIISKKMYKGILQHLGVRSDDVALYDKDGQLSAKGSCPDWMQVLRFASGGHFSYLKYPDIVNEAMGKHLKRVLEIKDSETLANLDVNEGTIISRVEQGSYHLMGENIGPMKPDFLGAKEFVFNQRQKDSGF